MNAAFGAQGPTTLRAMLARKNVIVLSVVMLTGTAGCGRSNGQGDDETPAQPVQESQRAVLDTIDLLQTAARDGDARRICEDVFTTDLVTSIEVKTKGGCPREVRRRLFSKTTSISVEQGIVVKAKTATAVIREASGAVSMLYLLQQAGRWRIDRVVPQKAG